MIDSALLEELGPEALRKAGISRQTEPDMVFEIRCVTAILVQNLLNLRPHAPRGAVPNIDAALQHAETACMHAVKAIYLTDNMTDEEHD